jgi:hypothetical protein
VDQPNTQGTRSGAQTPKSYTRNIRIIPHKTRAGSLAMNKEAHQVNTKDTGATNKTKQAKNGKRLVGRWRRPPSTARTGRGANFGGSRDKAARRRVLVVVTFHLRMMEATVFLGTFYAAEMFWYPSPDLCLDIILSLRSTDNSFNLMAWFLLIFTVNIRTLYRQLCAFPTMSNQFNLE